MRTKKKRELWIGLTALLIVFCVGWLVASNVYRKNSMIGNNQKVGEAAKSEATEKNEETQKQQEQKEEKKPVQKLEKSIKIPKKLLALYSSEGASLSWKKVKDADGYLVFRKGSNGVLNQIAQTEEPSYIDKDVKEKKAYRYRVCAVKISDDQILMGEMTKGVSYFHSYIDPDKPMIALTFDDGPSIYTPEILKTLKKYNARATFFVVGERVSGYAKTIKKANKLGCEIGSHSYSHANLGTASTAVIKSQLNRTEKKIKKVLGFYTPIMRPPYGSIGDKLRYYVGKPMILWSVDTLDWKTRNAKSTVKRILSEAKDGDIVLMHDLYSQSKDAAVTVIPKLIKKGYQLVTVSEMAVYKGFEMENGKAYTDMK